MLIENHGKTLTLDLQRQNLKSDPSGTAEDKLRFDTAQSATPRGSSPDGLSRLRSFVANLKFAISPSSPTVRTPSDGSDQAQCVGDLLGNLAKPANDAGTQSEIARNLAQLSVLAKGDLANLRGGREFLSTYLGELGYLKLIPLRAGVLGYSDVREELLSQVDPSLHEQAAGVLGQLAAALEERWIEAVVQAPLSQIVTLLSTSPVDVPKLEEELSLLSSGLDKLDMYLQSLPKDQLKVLLMRLRPERLNAAQEALAPNEGRVKRQQTFTAAPPETKKDPKERQFLLSTLNRLRESLEREVQSQVQSQVQPELQSLKDRLAHALQDKNRVAASKALYDLSRLVEKSELSYGSLPKDLAEDVRKLVNNSLSLFRVAWNNPDGPLSDASLSMLDDISLDYLRKASIILHPFGLMLDRQAAHAVGLERVEAFNQRIVQGMMDAFRTLSEETLSLPVLMRQLRDLSGMEVRRLQQLAELGQFVDGLSADDRLVMAQETCEQAMNQLLRDGQASIVHAAMQHIELLKSLGDKFGSVSFALGPVVCQKDYNDGGMEATRLVNTTFHLLSGMSSAMHSRLSDLIGADYLPMEKPSPSVELSPAFYAATMREQYGVAYNPATHEVTVLLTDSLRAKLIPELDVVPAARSPGMQSIVLLVNGEETEFTFNNQFQAEGLDRHNIRLSIRGAGADGQPIRYTWPTQAPYEEHSDIVEEASDAFVRVALSATDPLTRLMDYEFMAASVMKGLREMGVDSPFKLDDGTVVHPGGDGLLEFDVKQNEDGSFDVATTVAFSNINGATGMRPDSTDVTVTMNQDSTSWAEIQFALHVPSDARQIKVTGLPQFRYHFDVMEVNG